MRQHRDNSIYKLSRQISILFLAALLGLGMLNVGYSLWFADLDLLGTVNTGQWEQCGTGYAYGDGYATPFTEIIETAPWGWSNGPLSAGSYTFDIYASQVILVGTLTVDYDGATAIVTYNMNAGSTMDVTHLYVGAEPLPRNGGDYTTAPGQYPYSNNLEDATEYSYTVTGLSGEIYVVAHADVCWFE